MKKKISWESLFQFIAFIGTGLVAVSLMLETIFKGNGTVSQAFNNIGQAIAYIITMIVAGSLVRQKKHVAWLVLYVVFVVAIVVLYILGVAL